MGPVTFGLTPVTGAPIPIENEYLYRPWGSVRLPSELGTPRWGCLAHWRLRAGPVASLVRWGRPTLGHLTTVCIWETSLSGKRVPPSRRETRLSPRAICRTTRSRRPSRPTCGLGFRGCCGVGGVDARVQYVEDVLDRAGGEVGRAECSCYELEEAPSRGLSVWASGSECQSSQRTQGLQCVNVIRHNRVWYDVCVERR